MSTAERVANSGRPRPRPPAWPARCRPNASAEAPLAVAALPPAKALLPAADSARPRRRGDRISTDFCCGRPSAQGAKRTGPEMRRELMYSTTSSASTIRNAARRLKQIKALHWQTPARGSFDHQRLFGALANRITLKCRLASGRRLGMATNGGNGQR